MSTRTFVGRILLVVVLVALTGGPGLVSGQSSAPHPAGVTAQSVTQTLTAVADAYIRNLNPSANHGTFANLYVWYSSSVPNPDEIMYSLIRFDLAAAIPPEAIIESATLRVYLDAIGNTTEMLPVGVSAHPITSSWSETGVTWYGRPSVASAEVVAPVNVPCPAWKAWPVTDMVRAWHANPAQNYGVELRGPRLGIGTSYYLFFRSRESSPKPQLDVTYRLPSPYTRIYLPVAMKQHSIAGPIFSDDFSDGALHGWSANQGAWTNPGTYMRGQDTEPPAHEIRNVKSATGSNFTYEGTVALSSGYTVGIIFRTSADGTLGYEVGLSTVDNQLKLGVLAPNYGQLATAPVAVQYGHTYRIKVVANGSLIEVYLDGVKKLTATDSTYASGRFGVIVRGGLGTYQGTANFDNLEARALP